MSVAAELGLKPEQVQVRTHAAGGSFGRRANPAADYLRQAAAVFKAAGGRTPVQLVWTRTDDLHGGYDRSMFARRVRASVDASGRLQGWQHRVVGHSIGQGTAFEPYIVKDGVDYTSTEGAAEKPMARRRSAASSIRHRRRCPCCEGAQWGTATRPTWSRRRWTRWRARPPGTRSRSCLRT